MKKNFVFALLLFVSCAWLWAVDPAPRPFVSPTLGDHMVLQRGRLNHAWGWTQPGAEIHLQIAGVAVSTRAGADGRWQADFMPPAVGGPYTLTIDGPQHVTFTDILVGDVWLCSGQSNMAFAIGDALNGAEVVQSATLPGLRLFRVAAKAAYQPVPVVQGQWAVCSPEALKVKGGFSAAAFYFGRKIYQETGIPIGLIQAAVGGTPAESWMNPTTLAQRPDFQTAIAEMNRLKALGGEQYGNYINHWYDEHDRGQKEGWDKTAFDDSSWKNTTLKSGFADLGVPSDPAVCWFRTEVALPDPLPAGTAKILLGIVERMDSVFINGQWVGASAWVENPRAYPIASGVLVPGKNHLALRVLKTKPDGGFATAAADLKIVLGDGSVVPLGGSWKGAVSVDARPPYPLPLGYENWPTMPAVLYLGMIRPLAPLSLTGVLWYQGEANQERPQQYRTLLPSLVADWRSLFGEGDIPFYIVGLPAFMQRRAQAGETDGWTGVREAQALAARNIPHSGLAVTVDTGDADNIHPTNKQPVGERLALLALNNVYGRETVVCRGPSFASLEPLPGALRIRFSNIAGGLVSKGDRVGEFSIAGADRVWHWADARLDGDTVIVSAPEVPQPVAVRYAWQANPLASLFNGAGLPAEPFRTDDWDAAPAARTPRNLFAELLGKSKSDIDAKLQAAWQQLFHGDENTQRLYYEKGDEAWIADVGHDDVRSEGVSYGMMIAVQMDKKTEFDRLWKWARTHMYHADGPRRGTFAWQCRTDGSHIDPGSASDGEEWIAMSLFFAAHRWGNGAGIFNYQAEAQALLKAMRDSERSDGITAIFDPARHQVVFAPSFDAAEFTDPSYHLPAFYELWARWDETAAGREFWAACARESRAFFKRAAHPQTGLMPEYAHFDGTPYTATKFGEGKSDFRFDAWRIMANVAVDYSWFGSDPWAMEQSNRILRFFSQFSPDYPTELTLDGKPLSRFGSPGLPSMAAVAGLAADPAVARPFVERLWQTAVPSGQWRYYDGLVYFLGLLETSGNFRIYPPAGK